MKKECGGMMGEGWKMVRQTSAIYQVLEGEPSKCGEYRTAVSRSTWWLSQKPLWALGLSHGQQTKRGRGGAVSTLFSGKKTPQGGFSLRKAGDRKGPKWSRWKQNGLKQTALIWRLPEPWGGVVLGLGFGVRQI